MRERNRTTSLATASEDGWITFGETRIDYTVRRSDRRRSIGIRVSAAGSVEVAVPARVKDSRIASAIRTKGAWILGKLDERRRGDSRSATLQFVSGESIWVMGRQYRLKLRSAGGCGTGLEFSAGEAILKLPGERSLIERSRLAKVALEKCYRDRLQTVIPPIAKRFAALMGEDHSSIGFRVRDLGHRWGSCGKGRVLYFNWRLAMAPKSLIEFVVAHEICHLSIPDHSREFQQLLARILPDWEVRQERLDREGYRFEL